MAVREREKTGAGPLTAGRGEADSDAWPNSYHAVGRSPAMALDLLSGVDLEADAGEVRDAELAVTDDVLLKLFALGPGAEIDPHEHPGATNVFHVVRGTVVVVRDDETERVAAPGAVLNERGRAHGARNETDEVALLTAAICPLPG